MSHVPADGYGQWGIPNNITTCCQNITGQCAGNTVGNSGNFPCALAGRILKASATGIVSNERAGGIIDDGLARTCCDLPPCTAPGLEITTAAPLVLRPPSGATIDAVASLPLCFMPPGAALQWEWTCSDTTLPVDAQTSGTNSLRIRPFTYLAGASFNLTVVVALSSIPNDTSTATIPVQIEATPEVFAAISGGSKRRLFRGDSLTIDGTESSDPDSPPAAAVDWDSVLVSSHAILPVVCEI